MSARTDPIPLARTRGGGWSDTGRRWCRSCRAPRRFAVWPALSWMPHISSGSSAGSWTVHPTGGGPSSSADAFRLASPGRRAGTFRDRPVRRCAPTSTYPRRGPATIELGAAQRDIEDPCTPAFALDPAARRMPMRGVRCGVRQVGIIALLPMEFHEHPRVAMTNSVCNSGRDSTRPPGPGTDKYRGSSHVTRRRVLSSGPGPDA